MIAIVAVALIAVLIIAAAAASLAGSADKDGDTDDADKIDVATMATRSMILTADDLGSGWSADGVEYNNETGWVEASFTNANGNSLTISLRNYTSKSEAIDVVHESFRRMSFIQSYAGTIIVTNVTVANGTDSAFMYEPYMPAYTNIEFTRGNIAVDVRLSHRVYDDMQDYTLWICALQAGKIR